MFREPFYRVGLIAVWLFLFYATILSIFVDFGDCDFNMIETYLTVCN